MTSSEDRRRYHSPRREEQAEETRRRIIEAAAEAFTARGYAGTTMRLVARAAGVSVERVYREGSKGHLLVQAFRLRYLGEYDWESILGTSAAEEVFALTDPVAGLAATVDFNVRAHARSADLWMVLRATAQHEPEVAAEVETLMRFKRTSFQQTVRWLRDIGVLGVGPTEELAGLAAACDLILSPETYVQLRDDWLLTTDEYRAWALAALPRAGHLSGPA